MALVDVEYSMTCKHNIAVTKLIHKYRWRCDLRLALA
ncbi:hypothetical protein T11_16402 [Trichinella zimbabwensis]|uniref:Uncharacterized protein n=1 Tax=Trichinella zimbabwensis TaxID=268475 RepID=A0A0V1GRY6_9BILA|nr:hypothetical protein T11_16402 [Trichinella zimbabwensis]